MLNYLLFKMQSGLLFSQLIMWEKNPACWLLPREGLSLLLNDPGSTVLAQSSVLRGFVGWGQEMFALGAFNC